MKKSLKAVVLTIALAGMTACTTPSSTVVDQQRAVDTYVQLGLSYFGSGQREQARFNLLRALEIDRNSPGALHGMALLYQSEGELELAEQNFRRALSQDRNFTQARMNYARFLYLEGRFLDARNEYQRATQDTNYRLRSDAFVGLALSEMRLGNTETAQAAITRALNLNPNQPSALLEAADFAWNDNNIAAARNYLDRYETVAQQTARSLWLGVRLAWANNDPSRAASYGLALLEIYPDSREAGQYRLSSER